jgi:hypothetical protein
VPTSPEFSELMNGYERDLANARGWLRLIPVLGVFFLVPLIVVVVTRSSTDDWFPVIWLAAMTGLCAYAELLVTVGYYVTRRDARNSTTPGPV